MYNSLDFSNGLRAVGLYARELWIDQSNRFLLFPTLCNMYLSILVAQINIKIIIIFNADILENPELSKRVRKKKKHFTCSLIRCRASGMYVSETLRRTTAG